MLPARDCDLSPVRRKFQWSEFFTDRLGRWELLLYTAAWMVVYKLFRGISPKGFLEVIMLMQIIPGIPWDKIPPKVFDSLKGVFEALARSWLSEKTFAHHDQEPPEKIGG